MYEFNSDSDPTTHPHYDRRFLITDEEWEWIENLPTERRDLLGKYFYWLHAKAMMGASAAASKLRHNRPDEEIIRRFEHRQVVYLMHDTTDGLYKIGITRHIRNRLIQIAHNVTREHNILDPNMVVLVDAIVDGNEPSVQHHFADRRVGTRESEWFDLRPEDVEEFHRMAAEAWTAAGLDKEGDENAPTV